MTAEEFAASQASPPANAIATPSLRRRFLSMTYEAMLLFAVAFIADYLFDAFTQSRHALMLRHARQMWLFAVLGMYFVWFWTHGGQTLAMKTWRIRLVGQNGSTLMLGRALARYLLLWIFVLPTLAVLDALGSGGWMAVMALGLALVAPPFYALFDRERQFIHDRLLGTRLVSV
ncbi:MAG: RDD family protein [Burkholderiaceae bacterium]